VAAGVLGLATQQEVANLRATIQQLEDTVSTLEAKAAAARTPPAP
jgi:polyhydroxyalkanoate synthesis regulator phasin